MEVVRKAKKLFPTAGFTQIFGQVESCGLISLLRNYEHNSESKDARRVLRSCGSVIDINSYLDYSLCHRLYILAFFFSFIILILIIKYIILKSANYECVVR